MVHHFETEKPVLVLQIDTIKDGAKKKGVWVEFLDHTFITEKNDVADKIKATNMFQNGNIWLSVDSPIKGANRKLRVVSGARGLEQEDRTIRKELAELREALRVSNEKLAVKELAESTKK